MHYYKHNLAFNNIRGVSVRDQNHKSARSSVLAILYLADHPITQESQANKAILENIGSQKIHQIVSST